MQLMVMGFDIVPFQKSDWWGNYVECCLAWEKNLLNYTSIGLNLAQVKCPIISFEFRDFLKSFAVVFFKVYISLSYFCHSCSVHLFMVFPIQETYTTVGWGERSWIVRNHCCEGERCSYVTAGAHQTFPNRARIGSSRPAAVSHQTLQI